MRKNTLKNNPKLFLKFWGYIALTINEFIFCFMEPILASSETNSIKEFYLIGILLIVVSISWAITQIKADYLKKDLSSLGIILNYSGIVALSVIAIIYAKTIAKYILVGALVFEMIVALILAIRCKKYN